MNKPEIIFAPFPKMARLSREVLITEKMDGTNATVYVSDDLSVHAASRKRWITPEDDNFGFAAWVGENEDELRKLGKGWHRGEWWGRGIQRNYNLDHRRFSLFNPARWHLRGQYPGIIPCADPRIVKHTEELPSCCHLVPLLHQGIFDSDYIESLISDLRDFGSVAAPGFMDPEGVIVFHVAGNVGFKKTIKGDESPKGGKIW